MKKLASMLAVGALLAGGLFATGSVTSAEPAEAATNGKGYNDVVPDYYEWLGSYQNGKIHTYCTERMVTPPYSTQPSGKKVTSLTAASGAPGYEQATVKALTSSKKMRQINYLIDVHGQNPNNLTAAGVEGAIWIIRNDSGVQENYIKKLNNQSQRGKDIVKKAKALVADAEKNAVAPKDAPDFKGKVKVTIAKDKKTGVVTFPKGATSLQLSKGNKFKSSKSETVQLTAAQTRDGGTRTFNTKDANPKKEYTVKVTGKASTHGTKGWEAALIEYKSLNPREQSTVNTVGPTTPKSKNFTIKAEAIVKPTEITYEKPAVSTMAQETAEVGGRMIDTATVTGTLDRTKKYEIAFDAYLIPVTGQPKFNTSWNQIGSQTWSASELSGLNNKQKAELQKVYSGPKITVNRAGNVDSAKVTVKSHGTIYWSERFYEDGKLIHTGALGLTNETTKISRKGVKVTTTAQADAEVGGTMTDTAHVTGDVLSGSEIDFSIYLVPVVGAPKYDTSWNMIMGPEYPAQSEDPVTGAPLFNDFWANNSGDPLLDDSGNMIPTSNASGVAADGTTYPVPQTQIVTVPVMVAVLDEFGIPVPALDEDGNPILDENGDPVYEMVQATDPDTGLPVFEDVEEPLTDSDGNPLFFVHREPVMEMKRDPVVWESSELAGLSTADKAAVQRVGRTSKQTVNAAGNVTSPQVTVKSGGTIFWSERFWENGTLIHTGRIGLTNEKTVIGQPAVRTQATANASVGETITDRAIVSGRVSPNASYKLKFEAFKAEHVDGAPVCLAENEIFESPWQNVASTGTYTSPGFTVEYEHGETIWWQETLTEERGGIETVLHVGDCGIPNETTTVNQVEVTTKATVEAAVGDFIKDTAIVTGNFTPNDKASYEVTFKGFAEAWQTADGAIVNGNKLAETDAPVCSVDNQVIQTGATAVTGPGEFDSESVRVSHLFKTDLVWWVEQLWIIEGEKRTLITEGECGLPNETTDILRPEISSQALETATPGDRMFDIAFVDGFLAQTPDTRYEVTFEAFDEVWELPDGSLISEDDLAAEKPEPGEGDGGETLGTEPSEELGDSDKPVDGVEQVDATEPESGEGEEAPSVEDLEALGAAPVCEAENRLFETAAVPVNGPGEYRSPDVPVSKDHEGTVWWIETLWQITGDERIAVTTGDCGLFNETTEVALPKVTTKAVEKAFIGEDIFDTAIIEGPLSTREGVSYQVGFEAFNAVEDADGAPVCEADNRLFETDRVNVDGPGEYESPKTIATKDDLGTIWWIETLFLIEDGEEEVELHRGECGLINETTNVHGPTVTTTAKSDAVVGEDIYDVAHVKAPLSADEGVTHTLGFKAYLQPEDADAPVCEATNMIFEDSSEITAPGDHQSGSFKTTLDQVGTIYWIETLTMERDGTKYLVAEGECGLPNETTIVTVPEITTTAVSDAVVGEEIWDTAHVTGDLPEQEGVDYSVTFEAFQQPANVDAPVCEADNRIFESSEAISVSEAGDYDSESFVTKLHNSGTIYWIEKLWVERDGKKTLIAEGECGLPNETTKVTVPEVTTTAVSDAVVGEEIWDIAHVTGDLPEQDGVEYSVAFEAFHTDAKTKNYVGECTDANKVWESSKRTPVTSEGEYQSEKWQTTTKHNGQILWVEALYVKDAAGKDTQIHSGECGAKNEITKVTEKVPPLVETGQGIFALLAVGAMLIIAGFGVAMIRRSRQSATDVNIDDLMKL